MVHHSLSRTLGWCIHFHWDAQRFKIWETVITRTISIMRTQVRGGNLRTRFVVFKQLLDFHIKDSNSKSYIFIAGLTRCKSHAPSLASGLALWPMSRHRE